jgi:formate hydrogenlyase transcriptional activator
LAVARKHPRTREFHRAFRDPHRRQSAECALSELRERSTQSSPQVEGTLRDKERDHIIQVLRETGGTLSGPHGAAARLGLKRTTLQYKMQRLGISRSDYLK